mmetsp:Transcript_1403/g.3119  ORF Transcript_1403/g.3119 Transcript_1403/m.3119 type:complete len:201 (+) Transcript_1403:828-1430(+)
MGVPSPTRTNESLLLAPLPLSQPGGSWTGDGGGGGGLAGEFRSDESGTALCFTGVPGPPSSPVMGATANPLGRFRGEECDERRGDASGVRVMDSPAEDLNGLVLGVGTTPRGLCSTISLGVGAGEEAVVPAPPGAAGAVWKWDTEVVDGGSGRGGTPGTRAAEAGWVAGDEVVVGWGWVGGEEGAIDDRELDEFWRCHGG